MPSFEGYNQVYSYENKRINEVLVTRKKIISEVKKGTIKAYRNDSFSSLYPHDLSTLDTNEEIKGLEVLFVDKIEPDIAFKTINLKGVAPIHHLVYSGVDLGWQYMFYVKIEDLEKVILKNDIKLVTILSNLLFATYIPIEIRSNMVKEDISSNIDERVFNNMFTHKSTVQISDTYLESFTKNIIFNIVGCFEKYRDGNINNMKSGFYKDENLQYEYSHIELDSLLLEKEVFKIPGKIENDVEIDTFFVNNIFFRQFETMFINSHAIGMMYKHKNNEIKLYIPKTKLFTFLPNWLIFIFEEYLK